MQNSRFMCPESVKEQDYIFGILSFQLDHETTAPPVPTRFKHHVHRYATHFFSGISESYQNN